MISVGAYRLRSEFTTAGGGRCRWAEAEKSGSRFFIKEFLAPKYPTPESPGGIETKKRKQAACELFERRHESLKRVIGERVATGGNLVSTVDFFRLKTTYYKVTEWVDVSSITPKIASELPIGKRVEILATLAHSLRLLHSVNIVHGDLKPANILVKRTDAGFLAAKLIDFDDSYEAGSPPTPEEIVGDQLYYSPELLRYVTVDTEAPARVSAAAKQLGLASDIFSLGLIFHEYLVGRIPSTTSGSYLCEAIARGDTVKLGEEIPERLKILLSEMLAPNASIRPSIEKVFTEIRGSLKMSTSSSEPSEPDVAVAPKLTINLVKRAEAKGDASSTEARDSLATPPRAGSGDGRLRINMGKKK